MNIWTDDVNTCDQTNYWDSISAIIPIYISKKIRKLILALGIQLQVIRRIILQRHIFSDWNRECGTFGCQNICMHRIINNILSVAKFVYMLLWACAISKSNRSYNGKVHEFRWESAVFCDAFSISHSNGWWFRTHTRCGEKKRSTNKSSY